MRTWTLRHIGQRPVTMNQHRTLHHYKRAAVDKEWREVFHLLALEAKVPRLAGIAVTVTPLHKDGRSPQDAGACAPAAKAAVDGLVDARVIPDDTGSFVRSIRFLAPSVCGVDGMELEIEELPIGKKVPW